MDKVGLLLIGHGSKLPYNKKNLEKIAHALRNHSNFEIVEISFLERNLPRIPEAMSNITKQGINKLVVIPLFISHGVHTKRDIPQLLGIPQKESTLETGEMEIVYCDPLGSDDRIIEIIEEKALEALNQGSNEATKSRDTNAPLAPADIFETSINIIRQSIKDVLEGVPKTHVPIIERVVHATADPEFAKLVLIRHNAIKAGVAALKSGAKVITDVKMVRAGVNEKRLKKFGCSLHTYIDDERTLKLAAQESITRSAAAMRVAIKDGVEGSIFLIGNAPTAAFELVNSVKEGSAKPGLIIVTAVGFVGAAKSKEAISKLPIPSIVIRGSKGGSTIAVAVLHALLSMAEDNDLPKRG